MGSPQDVPRGPTYEVRLDFPAGARLRGFGERPQVLAMYGSWSAEVPGLDGLTVGGERAYDRDLVFRAWSEPSGTFGAEGAPVAALILAFAAGALLLACFRADDPPE